MLAAPIMLLGTCSGTVGQSNATYTGVLVTGAAPALEFGPLVVMVRQPNKETAGTVQYVLQDTSGNCSATILTQVSNDGINWITFATTTFASAASPQTDGFVLDAPWLWIRANVTAIAGTNASVYGVLGVI